MKQMILNFTIAFSKGLTKSSRKFQKKIEQKKNSDLEQLMT